MKLVFITREGYNLPGARIRCYNFAKEVTKYGIDTEVLSFSDDLGAEDGERESQMGIKEKIKYNWKAFERLKKEKGAVFYIQRLNYHSFAPYLVHLLNKNRIILDFDDWEMRENPKYYLGFYPSSKAYYLTKKIAKSSIFCVAASRFLQKFLLAFNSRVYYIPSGVDTELFRPSSNNYNGNRVVFSWIGTFHKQEYIENLIFALDCFCELRKKYIHIYLDIVGDGIYINSLIEAVKDTNDPNIQIKKWLPPDIVPKYLANVDVGLFPVVGDVKFNRAKSPTKLFEYMAMKKAVVASKFGEAEYVLKDGINSFLAEDKEVFIKKMEELILDANLRNKLGENAFEDVKDNYSLSVLGKKLYEILTNFN